MTDAEIEYAALQTTFPANEAIRLTREECARIAETCDFPEWFDRHVEHVQSARKMRDQIAKAIREGGK